MAEKTTRSTIEKKKGAAVKKGTRAATASTPRKPRRAVTKQETPAPVVELTPKPVAKRKSIFQAGTWISILMLLALVELAFYLNTEKVKKGAEDATPMPEMTYIFSEADGIVSSIEVKSTMASGETVKIARNAENVWAMILPTEAEANQGLAEAAATQLTALPISSQIEDGKSPEIFGLDKPTFIITVEFKDGKKRTLEVGDVTPTNGGYYVRVDKDKMVITDLSGIDALLQLDFFPPYLNTPIPPTEISVPTAEPIVTPAAP